MVAAVSCSEQLPRPEAKIIPQPAELVNTEGAFELNSDTKILINNEGNDMKNIAGFLRQYLEQTFDIATNEPSYSVTAPRHAIFIKLDPSLHAGREAYRLTVTPANIVLEASSPNGLFYGVQTIIQLMPGEKQADQTLLLPSVQIKDKPRFGWRGLHLDVSRHFMPKEFILKYLDYMAMHKLNTFHWHLTDDQGWRIEIIKYPKLTETGSRRSETRSGHQSTPASFDGKPTGGFYTQEEIKEIVLYAARRYITIVPEISMPGHALAALAAYPEYGCTGGPYEVATRWGIFDDTFCPGKDTTMLFIKDIIDETIALFPGDYIHIGGDDCRKTAWKKCPDCQQRKRDERLGNEENLQHYFIQQVEKYLQEKGKRAIGWEEAGDAGLMANTALMAWRGEEGGVAAIQERHYVVMAPANYCNFDQYQTDPQNEPLAVGGYIPLEKVYQYNPVPQSLSEMESRFVLGGQGMVWTEYMGTPAQVEYMLFPRIAALSEALWSSDEGKDYPIFKTKLKEQLKRYHAMGINYCKAEFTTE